MAFASGKIALAICDICGLEEPYRSLKAVVRNGFDTGLLACEDCWDPDHPQNFIDDLRVDDAIALKDPRPDTPSSPYRGFFGWNPVGNELNLMTASGGSVSVTVT